MRAIALQTPNSGDCKPDESVCEAVLVLWDLYFSVYNALSGAATTKAILVLLVPGGNGWRFGKWDHCKSRRGHRISFMESCDAKGSPDYWDGDCCAGDDLCGILTVQSVHP